MSGELLMLWGGSVATVAFLAAAVLGFVLSSRDLKREIRRRRPKR